MFENYYSFFHYCLLSCRYAMIQKSILNEPKWGGHKQSFFCELTQARSQKFAMGGCFGVLGRSPQPPDANGGLEAKLPAPEAGGSGAKPPAAGGTGAWGREPPALENFAFFCKNNFILGLFSLNNNAFKTWVRNWQCKQD